MDANRKYLESKILTASKEELMLMLFDGAIRFSDLAKQKLIARDFEEACRLLIRSQNIMLELSSGLRREDLGDQIFENLSGLYQSIWDRLTRASLQRQTSLIDEAVKLLTHIRETWAMSIEKDRKEKLEALTPVIAGSPDDRVVRGGVNLQG